MCKTASTYAFQVGGPTGWTPCSLDITTTVSFSCCNCTELPYICQSKIFMPYCRQITSRWWWLKTSRLWVPIKWYKNEHMLCFLKRTHNSTVNAGIPVKFLPEHNYVINSNRTSTFHTANTLCEGNKIIIQFINLHA
jgi:hypothetical protein